MNDSLMIVDDRELAKVTESLVKYMPGSQRLTEAEAESVARIALAHGLDPLNGEVWGLKGKDGKWYGVMVGVKGLRKTARRQLGEQNGSYWTEFVRVPSAKYNANPNDIVYECILRDTVSNNAYMEAIGSAVDRGIPWEVAVEGLGKFPKSIGVGIYVKGERTKMKPDALAKKRAEADAIKQRFDVTWANYDPEMVDGPPTLGASQPDLPVISKPMTDMDAQQILADIGYQPDYIEGQLLDTDEVVEVKVEYRGPFSDCFKGTTPYYELSIEDLENVMDALSVAIKEFPLEEDQSNIDQLDALKYKFEGAEYFLNEETIETEVVEEPTQLELEVEDVEE